ncbi:uncharacterized protein COLE_00586 [Cutaneotrichosporon oleaginosum]|uniref:uncharacterized protein n=1 Tax=Cutaneotrichosporon oleaginosum TaxID=879819 RepID=UPI00132B51E1|nr:hypothetical protein COLE_00586 [Cutaneotrichosporon oleaginosum]
MDVVGGRWLPDEQAGGRARRSGAGDSAASLGLRSRWSRSTSAPIVPAGAIRLLTPDGDPEFSRVKDAVSIQIFKIQSNVQGIQRLIDKLGTNADGPAVRTSLHNLTESTRDMVKKSTDEIKALTAFPSGGEGQAQRKAIQSKLSREYTSALQGFQRVQRLSAERQRSTVEVQKRAVELQEEAEDRDSVELERVQLQTQATAPQITQSELEFQEQLIAEREGEIREIESGIHELNDIFRDLGAIVQEQGGLIDSQLTPDNIESNIVNVHAHTTSAAEELTSAHEYQRKAGRRMACLLIILAIVALFILLAILA